MLFDLHDVDKHMAKCKQPVKPYDIDKEAEQKSGEILEEMGVE